MPADHARFRSRHQTIQPVAQRLDLSVNKRFIVTREFRYSGQAFLYPASVIEFVVPDNLPAARG
ncbi:hypothetical protein KCP73_24635 [Salmonella enterica subsp. enterica]|nr:hypothetical protein KCP73_24635 [Salmonella enterica subsp. enterica]